MIISELGGSTVCLGFWVLGIVISLVLGMKSNDGKKSPRNALANRFIPSSFRAISSYIRIVSSGASTVARSAASVASSFVDRDGDSRHDQVIWAGFDKLEVEGDVHRRVLLLGFCSGFQVWDVEEADNVRDLVSKHDVAVSFLQMLPNPSFLKKTEDKFAMNRPLLVVCADSSGGNSFQDGFTTHSNDQIPHIGDQGNGTLPTTVRFYSMKSRSYVHELKFRSVVYSVRCSCRVVAILQAAQIHCFDTTTLERTYTAVTNPVLSTGLGFEGYGPLAVGPRWVAYSGRPIPEPNSGRVLPKQFTTSASFSGFSSNGSVAHYAKESSKHLVAGIVTLGDMGIEKLSRYYSDIRPDNGNLQTGESGQKRFGADNSHHRMQDGDGVGMVIVRDIVSKSVVSQFRAHGSPISALCFDPSGTLLVTASVQGHNINVFKIMPGNHGRSDMSKSYAHLYQLQRGLTNAVIRDISFSEDSYWIMISSSRGTSHLFAINPEGGSVDFQTNSQQMHDQESVRAVGPPVTLSPLCRIRNGHSGWRGTVTGAAAAATGRFNSPSGAIASTFHNSNGGGQYSKSNFHLLVFSPSGSLIQYALRVPSGLEFGAAVTGMGNAYDSATEYDGKLSVEAIQKWNVCQKQNRAEREESFDIYGDHGNLDNKKIYPERNLILSAVGNTAGSKARSGSDEKHHLFYISEAELCMHQDLAPIWAKPEIQFQSMNRAGVEEEEEENGSGGEIQIERIPTRTLEVRLKELVPVFDYIRSSKNQTPRDSNWNSSDTGNHHAFHNKFVFPQKTNFFSGNGIEETTDTSDGGLVPEQTNPNGFMHKEDRLDHTDVNNRGSSNLEDPLKTVYSHKQEDLRMETHFEDKDVEFG